MAGYTYVGTAKNATTGTVVTYSPTAGNFIIVFTATSGGSGSPYAFAQSVSDTGGGTWKSAFGVIGNVNNVINDTGGFYHGAYYQWNCVSAITSVTVVSDGGTPGSANIYIAEYSGIKQSADPLLIAGSGAQTNPGTGTNAVVTSSINVPSQPCLWLSYCGSNNAGSNTLSAGTSPNAFTFRNKGNANSGNLQYLIQDIRLAGTGSINTTATATDSSGAASNTVIMGMAFSELSQNTGVSPTAGGISLVGGAAVTVNGQNTKITPFVARKGGLLVPDDRILQPERKIFLPTYYKRAA